MEPGRVQCDAKQLLLDNTQQGSSVPNAKSTEIPRMAPGEGAVWEHVARVTDRAPNFMDRRAAEMHTAFVAAMLRAERETQCGDEPVPAQISASMAAPSGQGSLPSEPREATPPRKGTTPHQGTPPPASRGSVTLTGLASMALGVKARPRSMTF